MATIQQVQKGFARFVDQYVAGAYSGIEKALVAGGASLLAANLPKLAAKYQDHPVNIMFGVYDKETGNVDLDSAYQAIVPQMGIEKIPISLPSFGRLNLGTLKIGKEEIDALMRCIREA